VPVPAARELSVMVFELSIGGEGSHHRKQPVGLDLFNHKQPGVFALARLRPEPGHPGRFLGVLEVFHRADAAAATLPSGLTALARSSPFAAAHAAMGPYDEFVVKAFGMHLIKERIKDDIVALAEAHHLGPDEFCDPENLSEYVAGNEVILVAYLMAGNVNGLPAGTSVADLARDAVYELCDEIEEEDLGPGFQIGTHYSAINILLQYLGAKQRALTTTGASLGFMGLWSLDEEGTEVKLTGMFTESSSSASTLAPLSAIKIMLGGTPPRTISNYLCPSQLPTAAILTTTSSDDTLQCSGGSLPVNQSFSLNIRPTPAPTAGIGGSIWAQQNGTFAGPFSITGP